MAMKQSGHKPAGGIGSNKVTHKFVPKVEPLSKRVNPAAADQLGRSLGNQAMEPGGKMLKGAGQPVYGGPGYSTPKGPTPQTKAGPGSGRTIHHSGSQGIHGGVAGQKAPQAREIIEKAGGPRVTK
jgi:hypothetical protein